MGAVRPYNPKPANIIVWDAYLHVPDHSLMLAHPLLFSCPSSSNLLNRIKGERHEHALRAFPVFAVASAARRPGWDGQARPSSGRVERGVASNQERTNHEEVPRQSAAVA